ncbi:hypothetical protein JZ751_009416, partial [Albula glossodonta]
MDQGACRLSGGGGGENQGGGSRLRVITVEDLESFSEDQIPSGDDSSEEDGEAMEEEEQDRLLHYWQDIGRVHQVTVPQGIAFSSQDMAAPIQQLTTNTESALDREMIPFTLISRKEKCEDVLYETRRYEKANWACVIVHEDTYEQSVCLGFMKLMRYICQQNSSG